MVSRGLSGELTLGGNMTASRIGANRCVADVPTALSEPIQAIETT